MNNREYTSKVTYRLKYGVVFGLVAAVLLTTVAGAVPLLTQEENNKIVRGEIKGFGPNGLVVVGSRGQADFRARVDSESVITKDKRKVELDILQKADIVRLKYHTTSTSSIKVTRLDAGSPSRIGIIEAIDVGERTVRVSVQDRVFPVTRQTVIMLNGALTTLEDLQPGMIVKVDYEIIESLRLIRLQATI